jgi:3-hydroxybutyrate dehydrogenase
MQGKTALVTGSTGGLGLSIARGLAAAGCNVVLHGLERVAAMSALCSELADAYGVDIDYRHTDLADARAIESMMRDIANTAGGIDILVNNAVVRHMARIDEYPVDQWDMALAVNLSAAFHTIRLVLPRMRERKWGRIFNMSSVYGSRAIANRVDYVTTKTALLGLTRAVAVEAASDGITCNALCPGSAHTPGNEARIQTLMATHDINHDEAVRRFLAGKQPSLRFVSEESVAALLVFLCGPAGDEINGATLPMDGGWMAG